MSGIHLCPEICLDISDGAVLVKRVRATGGQLAGEEPGALAVSSRPEAGEALPGQRLGDWEALPGDRFHLVLFQELDGADMRKLR